MLHGILVGAGSILLAGGAVELFRLMRKQPSAATVAATNAQTLQQAPATPPVVQPQPQQAQPAVQSVAQQAADLANSQQDTSGPTGDQGVPAGTLDPSQQAQIAANIAQTQAQIQAGNPPQDSFRDPNTGLNTANGTNVVQTSDPTLVNQIQNVLGI